MVTLTVDGVANERYAYTPSGEVDFLTADFESMSGSSLGWDMLFGGMQRESETGMYWSHAGFYHPGLGRLINAGITNVPESALYAHVHATPTDFSGFHRPVANHRDVAEQNFELTGIQEWLAGTDDWGWVRASAHSGQNGLAR